jgi:membrane protein required for colicin V production
MGELAGLSWPPLLDSILGLTVLLSLGFGIVRGFLREVLSLIAWAGAFWLAFVYGPAVAQKLDPILQNPVLSQAGAAVLTFVVVLVTLLVVASLITRIFKATGLTGMDRALGGIFGAVRALVIIITVLLAARSTAAAEQDWYNASTLVPYFDPVVDWASGWLTQPLMEGIGIESLDRDVLGVDSSTD